MAPQRTVRRALPIHYTYTRASQPVYARGVPTRPGVSNVTLDRVGARARASVHRVDIPSFSAAVRVFMRVQTFLHGRRNKHGKRDTAGHAVRANTAELRDTAKLKLLAEPPRRTHRTAHCQVTPVNPPVNESLDRFLRVLAYVSKLSGLFRRELGDDISKASFSPSSTFAKNYTRCLYVYKVVQANRIIFYLKHYKIICIYLSRSRVRFEIK